MWLDGHLRIVRELHADLHVLRGQDPVGLGNTIPVDDLRLSVAAWGGKAAM